MKLLPASSGSHVQSYIRHYAPPFSRLDNHPLIVLSQAGVLIGPRSFLLGIEQTYIQQAIVIGASIIS